MGLIPKTHFSVLRIHACVRVCAQRQGIMKCQGNCCCGVPELLFWNSKPMSSRTENSWYNCEPRTPKGTPQFLTNSGGSGKGWCPLLVHMELRHRWPVFFREHTKMFLRVYLCKQKSPLSSASAGPLSVGFIRWESPQCCGFRKVTCQVVSMTFSLWGAGSWVGLEGCQVLWPGVYTAPVSTHLT